MKKEAFYLKAQQFLQLLFEDLASVNLDVSSFELDHICWRCETELDYQEMEAFLLHFGDLFNKSKHNQRDISLIQLHKPITFKSRLIDMIELPAPKVGKSYPNGFEHAEFVVEEPLDSWYAQYPLAWNTQNMSKELNPDVKISFGDRIAKFHPYSLAYLLSNLE